MFCFCEAESSSGGLSLWNILSIVFGCLGLLVVCLIIYVIIRRPFTPKVPSLGKKSSGNSYKLSKERVTPGSPRGAAPLRWTPSYLLAAVNDVRRRPPSALKYIP